MSSAKESTGPSSSSSDEKHDAKHHHVVPTVVAEKEGAKLMEVKNADLAVALTSTQLDPLSRASIQLYLILVVAFMGSMSNGFDGQVRTPLRFSSRIPH